MANDLVNFGANLPALAEQWADQERTTGGAFLTTRGGVLEYGDEALPGNQVAVVVLDSVRENTYYAGKFADDAPQAPTCYAFGRGPDAEETMEPHVSMKTDLNYFKPQAGDCKSCRWNEWGSADRGRGKACQNRRRLALIPAGLYVPIKGSRDFDLKLFDDPRHFRQTEIVRLKLPVTSVKDWAKYVTHVSAALSLPPFAVVTQISLEPHQNDQYHVRFEMVEKLPVELYPIIDARVEEAKRGIIQGYMPPDQDQPGKSRLALGGRRA